MWFTARLVCFSFQILPVAQVNMSLLATFGLLLGFWLESPEKHLRAGKQMQSPLSEDWAQALFPVSHLRHKVSPVLIWANYPKHRQPKGCQCIQIYIIPDIFLKVIYMSEPLKASYSINCTPGEKHAGPDKCGNNIKVFSVPKGGLGLMENPQKGPSGSINYPCKMACVS